MNCDELYRRLTDHEEGTLDGDICSAVEEHLASCVACQAVRQDLRDLARLCREHEAVRLPDPVRRRIQELIASNMADGEEGGGDSRSV